jgi:hypothetical protein
MGKIKAGELVRTVFGDIYKVENLNNYEFLRDKFYNCIVKHSKNIIDLIEVGDFINGMQVDEFDDEEGTVLGMPVYEDGEFNTLNFYVPIESINIKTILTKEKFESECFKVEEQ